MRKYVVWGTRPDGQRTRLAECGSREIAELLTATLQSYKPAMVLEAANNHVWTDAFHHDPVKVVWKAEAKA